MDNMEAERLATSLDYATSANCALIEAMGMKAENDGRKSRGEAMAYNEDSFQYIIEKHRLQGF